MKIAIVANKVNQILNFRLGLIKGLIGEGHEIYIFSHNDKKFSYEDANTELKKLEDLGCKFESVEFSNHSKNPFSDLQYMITLRKLYKKNKIDFALHFTIKPNIFGTLATVRLKTKPINNVTGLGYSFLKENLTNKLIKLLYKISFRFSYKVFFQNYDDRDLFLENKLVNKDIVDRLPGSGMDIEEYYPMEKNEEYEGIRFLFIGRLSYAKGAEIYIKAAKKIKEKYENIEFKMIGQIYEEDKNSLTKEYIMNFNNKNIINYCGVSSDIRQQIRNVDCVILPSYYREGVPRSLIESASMGKPIITTDNVGCRDIVEDGYNGFLCKPKSVESLVEQIEKFLKLTQEKRDDLGKNGRTKVEKEFDEKIVIEKYLNEMGRDV